MSSSPFGGLPSGLLLEGDGQVRGAVAAEPGHANEVLREIRSNEAKYAHLEVLTNVYQLVREQVPAGAGEVVGSNEHEAADGEPVGGPGKKIAAQDANPIEKPAGDVVEPVELRRGQRPPP